MSFGNNFKPGNSSNSNLPQGVNLEYTSFGQQQNQKPYIKPPFQKDTINTQKTKPRGGWDDDDDDGNEPQIRGGSGAFKGNQTTQNQGQKIAQSPASANVGGSDDFGASKPKKVNPAIDYEIIYCDEKFVSEHEFENRTINDLIQPGGARMKQPDSSLNQFCSASESFQAAVISSLLLSKLGEDIPFVSKARTLFLIEAVVKKVKKYYDYFNYNLATLKGIDFSDGTNEGTQLNKILADIIKYIENPNKPKPIPVYTPSSATTTVTTNILDTNNDLLGDPVPSKGKQDPFAFIKKTTSDPSSTHSQQTTSNQQTFELLDDPHGFPTQTQQYQQHQQQGSFNQQSQAQPKKFNPFDIPQNNNQNQQQQQQQNAQNTSKPGLNFKKFQTGAPQQNTGFPETKQPSSNATPTNLLDSKFDQLEDLLASDLTIGNDQPVSKPSTNQQGSLPYQNSSSNQGAGPTSGISLTNQGYQSQQQQQQQGFPSQNQNQWQNQPYGQQGGQQNFNYQQGGQQKPTGPSQFNQQGGYPPYGGQQQGGQGGFGGPGGFQQQGFGGHQGYPQQQGFQGGYYPGPGPQYGYGQQQQQQQQQQQFYGQYQGHPGQFGGQQNYSGNFQGQNGGQHMGGYNNQNQWQQNGGFGKK